LHNLICQGIKRFIVLVGYKHEKFQKYFEIITNTYPDLDFEMVFSPVEAQSGKRVADAKSLLDEHFLLLYGDTFWPLDLHQITAGYDCESFDLQVTAKIVGHRDKGFGEYGFVGNLIVDEDNKVRDYFDSNELKSKAGNALDIGYFLVSKSLIPDVCNNDFSFQNNVLKPSCESGRVQAFMTSGDYHYVTEMDDLERFEESVEKLQIPYLETNYRGLYD
jgi:NDP-sugar pyrophosphorylase family protein